MSPNQVLYPNLCSKFHYGKQVVISWIKK